MQIWIDRIIIFVLIAFCFILYVLEIRNRSIISNRNNEQKWIDRWSLLSCTACLLRLFQILIYSIPEFCLYFNSLYVPLFLLIPLFITFYQIARLQYCFKTDYPSYYFILLYLNGTLVTLFSSIAANITQKIVKLHDDDRCITISRKSSFHQFLVGIGMLWFYIWDLYVIFVYIKKIKQLKNRMVDSNWENTAVSFKKVNIFLRKILILTLIIEITNFLWGLTVGLFRVRQKSLDGLLMAMTFICILLMVEHNNDKYVIAMRLFTRKKLCCCCNEFVWVTINDNDDNIDSTLQIDNINRTEVKTDIDTISNEKSTTERKGDITITQFKQESNHNEKEDVQI